MSSGNDSIDAVGMTSAGGLSTVSSVGIVQGMVLFGAGIAAGGLNALAGGGGFITLPALLWAGDAPVAANIGGTIAVWPGLAAALFAYRRNLQGDKHPLGLYLAMAVVGSALGAFLLLFTTNAFFLALLPWLLLFATALFIGGPALTGRLTAGRTAEDAFPPALIRLLLFCIAVYGGYFGGGMGIMTLAVLTLIGMSDIHEMNALKALLVVVINGVGVVIFAFSGKVDWSHSLAMTGGCVCGGYAAGHWVQRTGQRKVRLIIACLASAMTLYFFLKIYVLRG
jgi:uncharacterized membrane protein YfcA